MKNEDIENLEQSIKEDFIREFYYNLLQNQEELGHEFEKVLFDNLWDLYQS